MRKWVPTVVGALIGHGIGAQIGGRAARRAVTRGVPQAEHLVHVVGDPKRLAIMGGGALAGGVGGAVAGGMFGRRYERKTDKTKHA